MAKKVVVKQTSAWVQIVWLLMLPMAGPLQILILAFCFVNGIQVRAGLWTFLACSCLAGIYIPALCKFGSNG